MALDTKSLHDGIQAAFQAAKSQTDPDKAQATLIDKLTDAFDSYVRGGEVKNVSVSLPGGLTAAQAGSVKLS